MKTEIGIYQQALLEHHKNPIGFQMPILATHAACGENAICGDEITVEVNIAFGKIQELSFLGDSCAICRASASMMCQHLLDQPIALIVELTKRAMDLINGDIDSDLKDIACYSSLSVIREHPVRKQCALLPWQTFINAINKTNL